MAQKRAFQFRYQQSVDQIRPHPVHHPVIIIGAGPVGLTLALDIAKRGVPVVLLDDADRINEGSRAICFAKRTLEIFDRLGVAQPMLDKGVVWKKGKVFRDEAQIYEFDLLPEGGHQMPAFINLQQYYVEQYLIEAAQAQSLLDLRWRNKVIAIVRSADGASITIDTPDGLYALKCDWLVCCDGARSPSRSLLGLDFKGEVFADQFLIADVKMTGAFPTERWFWFNPPFHSGQSALLHRQPDDIWRIDLQLGRGADADHEVQPEVVIPRITRMLGHDRFSLEWVSVYKFRCCRLDRFIHGRVIFAGDSAHQVSPFGARGANSGIQDADNLGWKLSFIIKGLAPCGLIESYQMERGKAADENIGQSTRSTDFIAPRSRMERRFRDAVLELATHADFAKPFVNSGRLSQPTICTGPLLTPDLEPMRALAELGGPALDLPLEGSPSWLLQRLGPGFTVVHVGEAPPKKPVNTGVTHVSVPADGEYAARYGTAPGVCFLIRPDQHICARFKIYQPDQVLAAIDRALAISA